MLDAYSSVDGSGAFHSTIPSVSQRFGTMVMGLTTGKGLGFRAPWSGSHHW